MKRKPADPSYLRAQEMKDEAAEYTTSSLGSGISPRLTFRTPETSSSSSGPIFREGLGTPNWLLGLFAVIALMFILATINLWATTDEPPLQIPEPANPTVWTTATNCTVTDDGALTGTTMIIVSEDPSVRTNIANAGLTLAWNGSTGTASSEPRSIAPTDLTQIRVTDTILPAGSLSPTAELLRCGAQVALR